MSGYLAAYFLLFASVGFAISGVARLMEEAPGRAAALRRGNSDFERFLARLGAPLLPRAENERRAIDLVLLQAGYEFPHAAAIYFGIRLALALGLMLVSVSVSAFAGTEPARAMIGALTGGIIGMIVPKVLLNLRRKRYQRGIRESLPDMLDLMLVCSEAGLGLEMAIARVGEELTTTRPRLAAHLHQIERELLAGRSKLDALKAFADRTGVQEVISLVRLLVQSDALGTSIVSTLRIFAEEMQTTRLLRAEELAQKVSAKLSLVLVGCFMPAVMIAIIAPIAFNIAHTWKGLHP